VIAEGQVIPAQDGWELESRATGQRSPVVAWIVVAVEDEGPILRRVYQLWPMALVLPLDVPQVVPPDVLLEWDLFLTRTPVEET
jgi:hypothetical protein